MTTCCVTFTVERWKDVLVLGVAVVALKTRMRPGDTRFFCRGCRAEHVLRSMLSRGFRGGAFETLGPRIPPDPRLVAGECGTEGDPRRASASSRGLGILLIDVSEALGEGSQWCSAPPVASQDFLRTGYMPDLEEDPAVGHPETWSGSF